MATALDLPPTAAPSLRTPLLIGVLCLIWGSTWVVIQGGLDSLPPFGSAAARFTLAAACMTVLGFFLARREGGERPTLRLSLALGGLNFGTSYAIVYWSETRLPSGLVSVLWGVFPLLQAAAGHVALPGERLSRTQAAGFVLGFAGLCTLFATDLAALGPGAPAAGAVLLLSPVVSAAGTTYVKKHGARTSSVLLNRNGMWIGAALLWVATLATERHAPVHLDTAAVLSVLYLAVVGTVVSFGIYFWLLRHTRANQLAVIPYVTPALALSLGVALRGEAVTAFTVAGFALILSGLLLARRR
jgi:drug/metabolite transporter (DMT)-like permease